MAMADVHGSPGAPDLQMPQAAAGPAPVPYGGPDESPEPPDYGPPVVAWNMPGQDVMDGAHGGIIQESGYAHDTGAGLVNPYYPGQVSPIGVHGDADAGGRDDVSGSVAGAVSNATARYLEHEGDTHPIGSVIGDLLHFPAAGEDPGAGVGNTMPTGGFYDPDRGYGGEQGAPGYQGPAQ